MPEFDEITELKQTLTALQEIILETKRERKEYRIDLFNLEQIINDKIKDLQENNYQSLNSLEAELKETIETVKTNLNQRVDQRIDLIDTVLVEMVEEKADASFWSQDYPEATRLYQQAIKLGSQTASKKLPYANQSQKPIIDLGDGVVIEFIRILGGRFFMGGDQSDGEQPKHWVTVPSFLLGKTQVTQVQWKKVAELPKIEIDLNPDPSKFKGNNRPVEQVSWLDCQEFCARIKRLIGKECRLPSEAEWEYACRSGTSTEYSFGDSASKLGGYAWYSENSNSTTQEVAKKNPNPWGLYDMHGNVWEWCQDDYHSSYQDAPDDGAPWVEIKKESDIPVILRGGAWTYTAGYCRSAYRRYYSRENRSYFYGFCVASVFRE